MKRDKTRIKKLRAALEGCTYDQAKHLMKTVFSELELTPPARRRRSRERYFPVEQVQKLMSLMSQVFKKRHTLLVMTLFFNLSRFVGMRISEALQIRVADVDLDSRIIRLRRVKGGAEHHMNIPAEFAAHLQLYISALPIKQAYLFEKPGGGPYSPRAIQRNIERLREFATAETGIDFSEFSPHCLRHSFATEAIAAGAPIQAIQNQLNHKSPATTTQNYVDGNPLLRQQAIDKAHITRITQQGGAN